MERILKSFLKKLTNLSSSNRSICLLKIYRDQFLDLHRLDFLYKAPSFNLIEQLITGKRKVFLCDELDSRDEKVNEIGRGIKKIHRKDKSIADETGVQDLYIGWPFVKGKLSEGSPIRCPLLFFPVTLLLENGKWYLEQRSDIDITLNKSFLLAYSYFNHISLSDEWIETNFGDFLGDPISFRTKLYEFLKTSPIELNFNQDLFTNKLEAFKEYSAADYNSLHKNGELKLFSEAVLGIFPQAGSYLVPDYENLIEKNEYATLESFFSSKVKTDERLKVKEESSYFVFPIDASQEEALIKVKAGNSIVVQGPPGTGKSQLICNLVSDFVARGKRVAVVCRKKAALDVVYQRLQSKNIHSFVGLVHDFKNDRNRLFEQIRFQIEKLEVYEKQNNGLDTIYLERIFTQSSRQIQLAQEELDEFKKALYLQDDFGISAKELYLTSNPKAYAIPLKEFSIRFTFESSLAFERKISNYFPYAKIFMKDGYPWENRKSFADHHHRDKQTISDILIKIPVYKKQLKESAQRQLKVLDVDYTLDYFINNKDCALSIKELIIEEDDYFILLDFIKAKTEKKWLIEKYNKISTLFEMEVPEATLTTEELDECEHKIHKYLASRGNFLTVMYWNIFSGDKRYLKEVFRKNNLLLNSDSAVIVSKRIISRKKYEKEKMSIKNNGPFNSFPEKISFSEVKLWFESHLRILEAKDLILSSPDIYYLLENTNGEYKVFCENFQLIPLLARDIEENYKQWEVYLTPVMIQQMLDEQVDIKLLIAILHQDFDRLVEFDKIKKELLVFEQEIMQIIFLHEVSSEEDKISLFRNSLRLEWLEFLEEKYPILRAVSSFKLEQLERTIKSSIDDKINVCNDILEMRLKEGTYKNAEYNRLQNRITYRDLFHQVSKKKKLWPLRKVIGEFQKEIFDLIPCWLVSPESASALFPMEEIFDLVIFDEASQCFSEQGIPAIYRGKQIVIAGDSQQLKPNDLYQSRWEEDHDDIPDLEVDSLLDLSEKYLPFTQLTNHYRSNNLALIDFSNQYFYNYSLTMIPHFSEINSKEVSIEYLSVNGVWENNTNRIEAERIVQLTLSLLKSKPEKSIGIVTFNFKQAQLILDVLETESVLQKVLIPESLFVKNIENVQGDEKDIILFSVGYAADLKGKFSMQFGSLNQEGGENRLNVAITRAREKIYLIASIMPQQLLVEDSMHQGPKFLKKYLEYAYRVSERLFRPKPKPSPIQRRDWYLWEKLKKIPLPNEYTLTEELPFADLTVKQKNDYHSLILTDDYLYFQTVNSKAIHAYMRKELELKGWQNKWIFSRDFWLYQDEFKIL